MHAVGVLLECAVVDTHKGGDVGAGYDRVVACGRREMVATCATIAVPVMGTGSSESLRSSSFLFARAVQNEASTTLCLRSVDGMMTHCINVPAAVQTAT